MARVLRTHRAQLDLEEILDDLDAKSPKAAERLADEVDARCRALANFPEMGRARGEIWPDLRSTVVRHYVLFYRLAGDDVEVLRILHGRRDTDRIMKDER